MTGVDVQDLAQEDLPNASFPISLQEDFRLLLSPSVHRGIQQHAKADVSVEICGVLVGHWKQDERGPYAEVQNYIRCDQASSKFAEVTFTHESWSQINQEMDSKYDDSRIVGWYHSHPDFGIFLSDRDCFIQENFFSGSGQVAYVVDPIRDLEGIFAWAQGKPKLLPHYWIGEKICTSHSSLRSATTEAGEFSPHNVTTKNSSDQINQAEPSSLSLATQLLAWVSVFLLGYLGAGWRTSWERQRVVEGAVAHYGVEKVIKLGLQENLSAVQFNLYAVAEDLAKLPLTTKDSTPEQMTALAERRTLIVKNLAILGSALESIRQEYSFSGEERAALYRLVAQKHSEIRELAQQRIAQQQSSEKGEPPKETVTSEIVSEEVVEEVNPPEKETEAHNETPSRPSDNNQDSVER